MLDDVYNARMMELSADIPRLGRLDGADGSATAHSRLCGSTVTVDVRLDGAGRVSDYAHDVRACALGQAAASLVARHAVGMAPGEVSDLRRQVRAMLKGGGPAPGVPFGEFAVLEPVRAFKARHSSTLLAFDALEEAVGRAVAARVP